MGLIGVRKLTTTTNPGLELSASSYVHEQSTNHISQKNNKTRCYAKSPMHCAGRVSANTTRTPCQLHWSDWEMGTGVSCTECSLACIQNKGGTYLKLSVSFPTVLSDSELLYPEDAESSSVSTDPPSGSAFCSISSSLPERLK